MQAIAAAAVQHMYTGNSSSGWACTSHSSDSSTVFTERMYGQQQQQQDRLGKPVYEGR